MAIKVYLSPAAHACDRPCAVAGCSENTHVNAYLDALTPYLDACGIEWRRNRRIGSTGVQQAVRESNDWGAALHYVVHTDEADGNRRGSRLLISPFGAGAAWAEAILARRREIYPYATQVVPCHEMYEIVHTRATCVYERLVFHDNAEDARFLHEHTDALAVQTARAFCDIFGLCFRVPYAVGA